MNLSLLLGVSAFAKQEDQSFATARQVSPASQAFVPAASAEASASQGADGFDAALLAGAFRSLVDELMSGQRADDDAPIADASVVSEADDFAATLDATDDADEAESNEVSPTPQPQVWLVELEIVNRAAGVPTNIARHDKAGSDQTQDLPEESIEPDDALSAVIAGTQATLPQPKAPLPAPAQVGSAVLVDPQSRHAPAALTPRGAAGELPAERPAEKAAATGSAPKPRKNTDHATSEPVETVAGSRAPIKDVPVAPAMAAVQESDAPSQSPVSRSTFPVPGSSSGSTVQRSRVAKPESVTQNAEPRTLNQNLEPGTRNHEPLPGVAAVTRVSVDATAESVPTNRTTRSTPRSEVPSSLSAFEVRAELATAASDTNQSDHASDRGRQFQPPQPHLTLPHPVAIDVQTLGTLAMASSGHDLLPGRAVALAQPPIIAAPASANGSALPEETANQIVQSIRFQIIRGGGEATIRLEPKHFGELSITVRVEQGQVNARLQAESPVVREYLQNHQGLLRESLADQQLTLGKFDIAEPPAESRDGERRSAEERAFQGDRQSQRRRQQSPNTPFEPFDVVA
jgi:flagellar hook-length control protein FliK